MITNKHKGSIETEVDYEDAAKTVVGVEWFKYNGRDVALSRDTDYLSVTCHDVDGHEDPYVSVMGKGEIEVGDQYGSISTSFTEIRQAIKFLRGARSFAKTLLE